VQKAQKKLPPPFGELGDPPVLDDNLQQLLSSSQGILQESNPHAAQGINLFDSILRISSEWNGEEPVENAIDRLHEEKDEE